MKKLHLLFSVVLFGSAIFFKDIYLYIFSYLFIGYEIAWNAVRNLLDGYYFDENFLMLLATIGAIYIKEYNEAAALLLFSQIGESLQDYSINRSKKSITALLAVRPDYANLITGEKVKPEAVAIGDLILIRPGEKIPLDGEIVDGYSTIDMSMLTGESVPCSVKTNDEVFSGTINLTGVLKVKTTKDFYKSTVSQILQLVEDATEKKAKVENLIRRFATYYTPFIIVSACLVAIKDFYAALTFLVISCPCALVISVPLSFFAGIGLASRNGILIRASGHLEALAKAKYIAFDKTGTLTKGEFKVVDVKTEMPKEELLRLVAHAEMHSHHPIALSIKKEYGGELNENLVSDVEEMPGLGVKAKVDGNEIIVSK
jgi:Cd2+/Zn2+-exporting ATPase